MIDPLQLQYIGRHFLLGRALPDSSSAEVSPCASVWCCTSSDVFCKPSSRYSYFIHKKHHEHVCTFLTFSTFYFSLHACVFPPPYFRSVSSRHTLPLPPLHTLPSPPHSTPPPSAISKVHPNCFTNQHFSGIKLNFTQTTPQFITMKVTRTDLPTLVLCTIGSFYTVPDLYIEAWVSKHPSCPPSFVSPLL